jgi:hypothetical protein
MSRVNEAFEKWWDSMGYDGTEGMDHTSAATGFRAGYRAALEDAAALSKDITANIMDGQDPATVVTEYRDAIRALGEPRERERDHANTR